MNLIIVVFVAAALIVALGIMFQGRLNTLNKEKNELLNVIEDKDRRIENLIRFKPTCKEFRIEKTKTGYQLTASRDGRLWEAFEEMDAEGVVNLIISQSL